MYPENFSFHFVNSFYSLGSITMASNVELPSPFRLDLPPAPRDIDRRGYYDEKLELIDEVSDFYVGLRHGKTLEREFGCFQQAIFVLLDPGFLEGIKGDLAKVRSIGDATKDFANLCMPAFLFMFVFTA